MKNSLLTCVFVCLCTISFGSDCYVMPLPEDPMVTRIVSYLNIRDNTEYEVYDPSPEVQSSFHEEIERLPKLLQALYEFRVLRVIFIEDYATSGQVMRMRAVDNSEGYVIVLNAGLLDMTFNQWYEYQINKVIQINPDTGFAKMEAGNSVPGYVFVFIHEMFHILDYWAQNDAELKELQKYLGMIGDGLWLPQDELKQQYQLSKKLQFSSPSEIELEEAVTLFKELSQGPLLSFSSFQGRGEDFAEFMTFYCMEYYLGVQLELNFFDNNEELIYTYSPFRIQASCLDRKLVASFLFAKLLNQEG